MYIRNAVNKKVNQPFLNLISPKKDSSMKKLLSTKYSTNAVHAALLILRISVGVLMLNHGYTKLIGFDGMKDNFMNFLGIGKTASLLLVIFAEFFCSVFLILGLFTRLAAIPLVITMAVALFKTHNMEIFGKGELSALYLAAYIVLLLLGPGKISADNAVGK